MINWLEIEGNKNYNCIIVSYEPINMVERIARLENLNGKIAIPIDWSLTKYVIVFNASKRKKQYIKVYSGIKLIYQTSNYLIGGTYESVMILENTKLNENLCSHIDRV